MLPSSDGDLAARQTQQAPLFLSFLFNTRTALNTLSCVMISRVRLSRNGMVALGAAAIFVLILDRIGRGPADGLHSDPANYQGEPREDSWWMSLHEKHAAQARNVGRARCAAAASLPLLHSLSPHPLPPLLQRFRVVFFGDSITESWSGTQAGEKQGWCVRNAKAFVSTFSRFDALPLGLAGDQTKHLLWRLHKAVVLLIGTNDLGLARLEAEG